MIIPLAGVDDNSTPWDFAMALAEQPQMIKKLNTLLADVGIKVATLAIDVIAQTVTVTINGKPTVVVPAWRKTNTLTAYPADYIALRVKKSLNLG